MSTSITWSDLVNKIKGVTNRGAVSSSLNCGGSYTIPAGYHNGSGKITANSLSSQTDASAAAGQILSGYTAWVKGSKITGTMANKGNLNWSGSNTTYTVPAGYYSGGTLNSKTSYTNGYNAGVTAGKATARVVSGTVQATTNENVNYTGSTVSKRVVIINNIGGTPLAIFCRISNRSENTVRFGNTMFISQTYQVTSSHAWSSSSIHIPTNTTSNQTWSYWAVIV